MNAIRTSILLLTLVLTTHGEIVSANFTSAEAVPVTAADYSATGNEVEITLSFAPSTGTQLTIVENTGLNFIAGEFSNLSHGQRVDLIYDGITYPFVASYFGGSGNDLVLRWGFLSAIAWGNNNYGQLGNDSTTPYIVPVAVSSAGVLSGKTVVAVAARESHSLALCSDGNVFAWGNNSSGQLGNNSTRSSHVPVAVTNTGLLAGNPVVAVAAGASHSLALSSDGMVFAWGENSYGQLGNNSTTRGSVPVAVSSDGVLSGKTVVAVAAGESHSLALCSDGKVVAWGHNNSGQLGNNSTANSGVPVAVISTGGLAGKTVVAVAAGSAHSLALCSDGKIFAWGNNSMGQLGNNSTTYSPMPVAVTSTGVLSGKTVVAIAAGFHYSLALRSDGKIVAWGFNYSGQLGNNSTTDSKVPVAVTSTGVLSGRTVVAMAAGVYHVLALCSDGMVAGWGANTLVPFKVTSTSMLSDMTVEALATGNQYSLALAATPITDLAKLSSLSINAGALSPAFSSNMTSYSVTFPNSQDSIAITPTLTDPSAAVTVNGSSVASGCTSQPIQLVVGMNIIPIIVTGKYGGSITTYTVSVARKSADSSLSALALGSGSLTPGFSSGVLSYAATVGATTTSVTVTPIATHSSAIIKVNGATVVSGVAKPVGLVVGNNIITIVVTAEDAAYETSYTLNILRPSNVATLSTLSLSTGTLAPGFSPTNGSYTATVPNSQDSIALTPSVTEPNATVAVNGSVVPSGITSQIIPLVLGVNVISTVVTAQDGVATKTYTVTVTRRSTDSTLSALALSSGALNPGFSPDVLSYTATVGSMNDFVMITPRSAQPGATIRVNGSILPSGSTQAINLAVGYNTSTILVTAQDPAFTTTYTLTIFRPSNVCTLSALSPSIGALVPTFSPNTLSYSMSVPNAVNSLAIQPTVTQANATVTVNGNAVVSGGYSPDIPLAAGTNVISLVVTAEDGVTTLTYTLTVTRQTDVTANFTSVATIPATAGSFSATDKRVNLSLAFAPATGTSLTVVKNTGLDFISGQFLNLAHGQMVTIAFNQMAYRFVANYYGGTGNDLVLQWADTKAYAWGSNSLGQLGRGGTSNSSLPVTVATAGILSDKTVIAGAVGSSHSIVLCSDGTVAAWGNNTYGQLGDGSNDNRDMPVALNASGALNGKTMVAVAAGFNHCLALCSDGSVAGWGMNSAGQLGNGNNTSSNLPVTVAALANKTVVAVFAGYNHSLARCADGSVLAWGSNAYGQLGNNSTTNSNAPIDITHSGELFGRTVISLVGGSDHSIALCSDGTLLAWGRNNYGQLGNDSTLNSSVPVVADASDVLAGKAVVSIAAGGWHGLATCSDGSMAAFGRNTNGQLGNGLAADSPVPVAVDSAGVLTGKVPLIVGGSNAHSLVLCADGSLAGWGSNNNGQLGNGSAIASNSPVAVSTSTLAVGERFSALATGSSASHVLAIVAQPPPQGQPFAVWQATHFPDPADQANSAISGETATPGNDGITNLMKYALGLNPWITGNAGLPFVGSHEGYLTLTYRKNKQATDVVFLVQAGDSLEVGSWATAETVVSQVDAGDHWLITVRDNVPMAFHSMRFMALKVER